MTLNDNGRPSATIAPAVGGPDPGEAEAVIHAFVKAAREAGHAVPSTAFRAITTSRGLVVEVFAPEGVADDRLPDGATARLRRDVFPLAAGGLVTILRGTPDSDGEVWVRGTDADGFYVYAKPADLEVVP